MEKSRPAGNLGVVHTTTGWSPFRYVPTKHCSGVLRGSQETNPESSKAYISQLYRMVCFLQFFLGARPEQLLLKGRIRATTLCYADLKTTQVGYMQPATSRTTHGRALFQPQRRSQPNSPRHAWPWMAKWIDYKTRATIDISQFSNLLNTDSYLGGVLNPKQGKVRPGTNKGIDPRLLSAAETIPGPLDLNPLATRLFSGQHFIVRCRSHSVPTILLVFIQGDRCTRTRAVRVSYKIAGVLVGRTRHGAAACCGRCGLFGSGVFAPEEQVWQAVPPRPVVGSQVSVTGGRNGSIRKKKTAPIEGKLT